MGWYGHLREKREKGVRPVRTFKGEGKKSAASGRKEEVEGRGKKEIRGDSRAFKGEERKRQCAGKGKEKIVAVGAEHLRERGDMPITRDIFISFISGIMAVRGNTKIHTKNFLPTGEI